MTADLHPTKARLALLSAVGRGEVVIDLLAAERPAWRRGGATVTARMREMSRAGWVAVGPRDPDKRTGSYLLTDAGRAILAAAS